MTAEEPFDHPAISQKKMIQRLNEVKALVILGVVLVLGLGLWLSSEDIGSWFIGALTVVLAGATFVMAIVAYYSAERQGYMTQVMLEAENRYRHREEDAYDAAQIESLLRQDFGSSAPVDVKSKFKSERELRQFLRRCHLRRSGLDELARGCSLNLAIFEAADYVIRTDASHALRAEDSGLVDQIDRDLNRQEDAAIDAQIDRAIDAETAETDDEKKERARSTQDATIAHIEKLILESKHGARARGLRPPNRKSLTPGNFLASLETEAPA